MDFFKDQYSDQFLKAHHYSGWQLIKSYWQSPQRVSAYFYFIVIMSMTIFLVGIDVFFNYWYNYFYNALQTYNKHGAIRLLVVFFVAAGIYIVFAVYRFYISQIFALRWRRWLTEQYIGRWLRDRGYYYLENFDVRTDNPDQRIQEDITSLVNYSIELSTGLISAIATILAFLYVLWKLSGILVIPLGSWGTLHIPGYLVWVGLLYNFVGTVLTIKIGYPLVALNFEQQRREATFRFSAIDLRSHSENVALYNGEEHQKNILQRLFKRVLENWYLIILRQKLLLWFTAGFNQAAVVLPLIVALPNYFDKVFLLGGLIQSIQAFGRVQDSLAFIVNSYTTVAQWQAVCQRLTTFANHISEVEDKVIQENRLTILKQPENSIAVNQVTINTPRHELLLKNIETKFIHGQHYLIKGESGIGKSTFVRTVAGIWPYASGEIIIPQNQRIMYLPQKPYMPIGTLAEAILFPDHSQTHLNEQLEKVLQACHLENFIPRLHETASWSEQLSPGEQQRIAFARVLVHKPDWVFLDESTSMLDLANEKYLYQLIKSELPKCSVVSVGHRPSLDVYHDQIVNLEQYA